GRPEADPEAVGRAGTNALHEIADRYFGDNIVGDHDVGAPLRLEALGDRQVRIELGTHDFGDDPTAARTVPDGHGGYRIELSERLPPEKNHQALGARHGQGT